MFDETVTYTGRVRGRDEAREIDAAACELEVVVVVRETEPGGACLRRSFY